MKRLLLIIMLTAAAIAISGCRTAEGFGEDVQWTGETISGAAR